MMTMVLVSGIIARIALTVAFYLLGVRFGAYVSFNEQIANCRLQEELLHTAREFERSHSQITISSSSAVSNLQDCIPIHKSSYPLHHGMSCRHAYEERRNLSVLHLAKATVPEDVFSFLHHPSSPSKWSFFFTQTREWPSSGGVLQSPCAEIYLTRTGSRSNQPNKCVAVAIVPQGGESIVQQSHRVGYTALNTNQYQQDYPVDYGKTSNNELLLLPPLLQEIERLRRHFVEVMGDPVDAQTGLRRVVTIMVANSGVMDLLLNFICSAEAARIDLSSIVVFVGEEEHSVLVQSMGAKAVYHPALGSMPKHAAEGYLDDTFARMMWFKTTSVYLALSSGFEVLFQDVDLVWLKDPFPYFRQLEGDLLFMDDGARTPRYTPFFVNSGFYFVKHNDRTLYMFEKMMKASASEIGQTHSHQSVLIRHIAEAHHLFGLRIFVLDTKLFPSGQTYHENKRQVKKIQERSFRPFVFHMCWTSNRVDKVVYFKDVGLWYLPDSPSSSSSRSSVYALIRSRSKQTRSAADVCNNGDDMLSYAHRLGGSTSIRDKCCIRDRYWPVSED